MGGSTNDSRSQLSVGIQEAKVPQGSWERGDKKKSKWMSSFPAQLMELYSDVMTRSCSVLVAFKWARPNFSRNPVLLTHDALLLSSHFLGLQ